jgi:hypothetical protein
MAARRGDSLPDVLDLKAQAVEDEIVFLYLACGLLVNGAGAHPAPRRMMNSIQAQTFGTGTARPDILQSRSGSSVVFSLNFMGNLIPLQISPKRWPRRGRSHNKHIIPQRLHASYKIPPTARQGGGRNLTQWLASTFSELRHKGQRHRSGLFHYRTEPFLLLQGDGGYSTGPADNQPHAGQKAGQAEELLVRSLWLAETMGLGFVNGTVIRWTEDFSLPWSVCPAIR